MAKTETCCASPSAGNATKNLDFAAPAFSKKDVAIGRGAHEPRVVEAVGVELNLEADRSLGPRVFGTTGDARTVIH